FFFSSRRRHTRLVSDWSSDVCSSDLVPLGRSAQRHRSPRRRLPWCAPPFYLGLPSASAVRITWATSAPDSPLTCLLRCRRPAYLYSLHRAVPELGIEPANQLSG